MQFLHMLVGTCCFQRSLANRLVGQIAHVRLERALWLKTASGLLLPTVEALTTLRALFRILIVIKF